MFTDPQFWVAIAFFIFIAAIFLPVKKIVTSNLDSQIDEIKNKIDEAENLKNEAQLTLGEIKKRQSEVQKEIDLIQSEAKSKIAQIENEAHKKLNDQIEKRKIISKSKIDQLVRDTNTEIQEYISSTAIKATIVLLEQKLSDDQKENLINASINEMSSVIKN